jgi:uncharacterized membrane protein YphA (DoxX/SURF4 family)
MPSLHTPEGATYLLQTFTSAFLAILFLQSGIDKVMDRRGNLEWLKGHFAKSPLAGTVPALLTAITILELAAGVLSVVIYPPIAVALLPSSDELEPDWDEPTDSPESS